MDLEEEDFQRGAHYSDSRGLPELRTAIIQNLYNPSDIDVDNDSEILITAGSKLGCYIVFKSILNAGESILLHEPAWVTYSEHARLCGAKTNYVPHGEDLYEKLTQNFEDQKLRILVLNNPTIQGVIFILRNY